MVPCAFLWSCMTPVPCHMYTTMRIFVSSVISMPRCYISFLLLWNLYNPTYSFIMIVVLPDIITFHSDILFRLISSLYYHWWIQGALPACTPPTGSNSFLFTYVFTKKHPHRRLVPPQWEILDLPLIIFVYIS